MPHKVELPCTRFLSPDGQLLGDLPAWADDLQA